MARNRMFLAVFFRYTKTSIATTGMASVSAVTIHCSEPASPFTPPISAMPPVPKPSTPLTNAIEPKEVVKKIRM